MTQHDANHQQGQGCEECRQHTIACYLGLWRWIRSITVEEWIAIALVVVVLVTAGRK